MHATQSILLTAIEQTRRALEMGGTDKYDDDYLVRYMLQSSYAYCLTEMNLGDDAVIICKTLITLTAAQTLYTLPANCAEVVRLLRYDDAGRVIYDWRPNTMMHPLGSGWRLNGNILTLESPLPEDAADQVWELWYVPSGDCLIHYATDGSATATDTITLSAAPAVGLVDRRPGAYVGAYIRVLQTDKTIEERIIKSFDATTREVVVHLAFSDSSLPDSLPGAIAYEIMFPGHRTIMDMMAANTAMGLAEDRDVPQDKLAKLDMKYRRAKKAAMDRIGSVQSRTGHHFVRYTVDNPEAGVDIWRVGQR